MGNLRIIADNAVDRAQLSASSAAGLLAVTNLQTDKKSDVWRATGRAARLTAAWPAAELISGVALPFCNLSPTATWRVRLSNEAAITNLRTYSEAFENAAWVKTNASIAVNAGAAPDGSTSARRLVPSTTNGQHAVQQSIGAVVAGEVRTESIFVRRDTGEQYFQLAFGAGFPSSSAMFDLAAGSVSALSNCAPRIEALPGGWYRCSITATANASATSSIQALSHRSAAGSAYAGGGATGILIWGAMGVVGPATGSYYPAGAAAATRPAGYIDTWQSYDYDSGQVLACPAPAIKLRGWTAAASMSAYAYGGGACARHWLPAAVPALGMAIDISDPDSLQGYVEAACFVAGEYWAPTYGASAAAETFVDGAEHYETAAGDLLSRASTVRREVPIELRSMSPADRAKLANILRASRAHPIFLSVFAGHADLDVERAHTVYGKRASDSEVEVQAAMRYGTKITVRSI